MVGYVGLFLLGIAAVSALPAHPSPVILKLDEQRYHHVADDHGNNILADLWMTTDDLAEVRNYDPDRQNIYHLFTRQNPIVSQPMLIGSEGLLGMTNYDARRRTVVLLHGWRGNAISDVNTVLIPAFLSAEDVNIIVVDWSVGADTINYVAAVANTVSSGESVARFINWLNTASVSTPMHYHIVGHNFGGHKAGIVARHVDGDVAYVTGLDPSFTGWIFNSQRLNPSDAAYTEAIHTNAGLIGYLGTLANADFYPNGGVNMPGCNSQSCDHDRSFHYFAESLHSGGFSGRRCATYITAMTGTCFLPGSLQMGGLVPKIGSSGIFHLRTNTRPPFSQG